MLGRNYPGDACSAARALELVGERWSLLLLRDAMFRGFTRFSQFQGSLGIASNILSVRLGRLVEAGLMRPEEDPSDSRRREYHLTEMGLSLKPAIIALTEWGDRWLGEGPVEFVDPTGAPVLLELRRDDGGIAAPDGVVARQRRQSGGEDSS